MAATYLQKYRRCWTLGCSARKCEIELKLCTGVAEPVSVYVNTYGTASLKDEDIAKLVRENPQI